MNNPIFIFIEDPLSRDAAIEKACEVLEEQSIEGEYFFEVFCNDVRIHTESVTFRYAEVLENFF